MHGQEVWWQGLCGCPENYIIKDILTWKRRRPSEEQLDATLLWALAFLHQTAQGWKVERSLSCRRLVKIEKRVETRMIQYLEVVLYQSSKCRIKRKHFTEDSYLRRLCVSSVFISLPHSTYSYILANKKKRSRLNFYTSALFFYCIQHTNSLICKIVLLLLFYKEGFSIK